MLPCGTPDLTGSLFDKVVFIDLCYSSFERWTVLGYAQTDHFPETIRVVFVFLRLALQ